MNWPTCDDTSNTGELVAENAAAASQDAAFSTVGLNVYKFSSKVVTVPFELLQDSQINIDALVVDLLAERLGRVQNTYFTTGTGSSQPKGIVTAAASGKTGTTGQTSTVIYDDLVDLIHSIDPAYRQGGKLSWMMNDASVKVIRKIKDGQSRPIFVPGYETGVPGGAPDTLLGYDLVVNQDVATMAANAKSILFGRLGNYRIRDVMSATLFRFTDSAYTKNGQVGFLAWMRAGGNLIDLSGATVKYYANSAT
jgi:HK97 family phage major capsid protein